MARDWEDNRARHLADIVRVVREHAHGWYYQVSNT